MITTGYITIQTECPHCHAPCEYEGMEDLLLKIERLKTENAALQIFYDTHVHNSLATVPAPPFEVSDET